MKNYLKLIEKKHKIIFVFLFLLVGCGYKFENHKNLSIQVPYIEGDKTGFLTNKITEGLANSGIFYLKSKNAKYSLVGRVISDSADTIGYRRDRHRDGMVKKNVVPTESRVNLQLEVKILSDSNVVFGPKIFSDFANCDFVDEDSLNDLSFINKDGNRQTVLSFSLGQLESVKTAQNAARDNMYRKIAIKIVDLLACEFLNNKFEYEKDPKKIQSK